MRDDLGAEPAMTMADTTSAVLLLEMRGMRKTLDQHIVDDGQFQAELSPRLHKLEKLRWYATGIIVAILGVGGVFYKWGPYIMGLAVKDVVSPQIEQRSDDDRAFLKLQIKGLQESVDKSIEAKFKRIKPSALKKEE